MKQKVISILVLIIMSIFAPSVVLAQSIFAKQKVVISDVRDKNDVKLDDPTKLIIRQSFIDACTNSEDFEVFNVNINDIKRELAAKGQKDTFSNICKAIGSKADYIIFIEVMTSSSDRHDPNMEIFITCQLYRIATASMSNTKVGVAKPNRQSIIQATSKLISSLLGITSNTSNTSNVPPSTQPTQQISNDETFDKDEPFVRVEKMPSFLGGDLLTFRNWLMSQVKYPQTAQENNTQGRVLAQFTIDKSGSLTDVEILQSPDQSLSEEVIRVLYTSPKWTPGEQRNIAVKVKYTLPIDFRITNGETKSTAEEYYSKGVELSCQEQYDEAVKWYRKAAEQGYAKAQNRLGVAYAKGKGVTQDYYEAVKWYRKAALQGNTNAKYNLGVTYKMGRGVTQDTFMAVKWFREAAKQGYLRAMYELGLCYEKGEGVTQNLSEARKYYQQAADKGNSAAKKKLENMY